MIYPKLYLYRRIVQAKSFIDKYFQNNIDVSHIAEEARYSKFHFIRLFKKAYGCTPHQYLVDKRIDHAKYLLQQNRSVTSTCFNSGFRSLGSFSALFKQKTGLSPSLYAQKYVELHKETRSKPEKFIPGCYLVKSNFQEAIGSPVAEIDQETENKRPNLL